MSTTELRKRYGGNKSEKTMRSEARRAYILELRERRYALSSAQTKMENVLRELAHARAVREASLSSSSSSRSPSKTVVSDVLSPLELRVGSEFYFTPGGGGGGGEQRVFVIVEHMYGGTHSQVLLFDQVSNFRYLTTERELLGGEISKLEGTKRARLFPVEARVCASCGASDAPTQCSACNAVVYCGQECADRHWEAHQCGGGKL